MYFNKKKQKELFYELAKKYLYELYQSQPYGRDESPSLYLIEGELNMLCRLFDVYYKVQKRYHITFYRGSTGEGSYWFNVVSDALNEEQANTIVENIKQQNQRIQKISELF